LRSPFWLQTKKREKEKRKEKGKFKRDGEENQQDESDLLTVIGE
jgi:hypothetical protein